MKKSLIAAGLALAAYLPQAEATEFDFSYYINASQGYVTGRVEGQLLADHNTVIVDSTKGVKFFKINGVGYGDYIPGTASVAADGGFLPNIWGLDHDGGLGNPVPTSPDGTITFDGSYLDIIACNGAYPFSCFGQNGIVNFFGFAVGDAAETEVLGPPGGGPFYFSYGFNGNHVDDNSVPYVQANWHLTGLPTPATLPLLAIGGAAMGWRRRKAV